MKKLITILLFISPFVTIGQPKLDTSRIKLKYHFQTQPAYFIDSTNIDLSKDYIDLTNIKNIKVTKDSFVNGSSLKVGKVFITSKNKTHNWVTLADFKNTKPISDTSQPKIYIIDGILISDTSKVRIEATFIKSLDILNMAETPGFYHDGPDKTIFIITTNQPFKKSRTKNSR